MNISIKLSFMLKILNKIYQFILRYFPNYTGYILRYSFAIISPYYRTQAEFYSDKEFHEELNKGKSIIRLGDGEIGLLHGRDIHYQKHSKALELDIKKIIRDYNKDSRYILSIPLFVARSNKRLLASREGGLQCWLPLKVAYKRFFNKNAIYADQHFSYHRIKVLDIFNKYIFGKNVIIVTKIEDIQTLEEKQVETNFFKSMVCIESPTEESYETKDIIFEEIMKVIACSKVDIVLLACGPLSKILAYNLSQKGICAYDIGFGLCYLWTKEDFSHRT
jgi:Glycosyltransferase GT-D fold